MLGMVLMIPLTIYFPGSGTAPLVKADVISINPLPTGIADSSAYPPSYFDHINYTALREQYVFGDAGSSAERQCRSFCIATMFAGSCKSFSLLTFLFHRLMLQAHFMS